jgi:hypothetical protein
MRKAFVAAAAIALTIAGVPGITSAGNPGATPSTSSTVPDRFQTGNAGDQPVETSDGIPKNCPPGKYVNCMPPLAGRAKTLCSPESLKWIKEHCPGLEVVY